MEFIDSHCHLHDEEFFSAEAAEGVLKRSIAAGVRRVMVIGTSLNDSKNAVRFAENHTKNVWATIGAHPQGDGIEDVSAELVNTVDGFAELKSPKIVAIGEIGLDYHCKGCERESQMRLFEEMMQVARDRKLPVVFHIREAYDDAWSIIDNFSGVRGVVHSFSDDETRLEQALKRDFYVGVNGLATFAPIPLPPIERMLLETDAPFLAPVPHRGKPNEPAYVPDIARFVARKLDVALDDVARITTENSVKLFSLD